MKKEITFKKAAVLWATGKEADAAGSRLTFNDVDDDAAETIVLMLMDKRLLEEGAVSGVRKNNHLHYHMEADTKWDPREYAPGDDHGPSGNWVVVGHRRVADAMTYSVTFFASNNGRALDVSYDREKKILSIATDAIDDSVFHDRLVNDQEALIMLANSLGGKSIASGLRASFNELSKLRQPSSTGKALDEDDIEKLQKKLSVFRKDMAEATKKLKGTLEQSGLTDYLSPDEMTTAVRNFTGKALKL